MSFLHSRYALIMIHLLYIGEFAFMKLLFSLALTTFSFQLIAATDILFERNRVNNILKPTFDEVIAYTNNPPRFYINHHGFLTYGGSDGDFGVLFTEKEYKDFILDIRILMPSGDFQYANSGVFFRFKDPRVLTHPYLPYEVKQKALNKSRGFVAEWSSYEVQLIAGSINSNTPWNKHNGSFYGVEDQVKHDFNFYPGQFYDVRVEVVGQSFKVFMKWEIVKSIYLFQRC